MNRSTTLLSLIAFFLLATIVLAQSPVTGTVYQTTNVRSGPDTRFEIVGQLSAGDRVQVNGRDDESRWLRVILPSGTVGWLPAFALILDSDLASLPAIKPEEGTPSASGVSVISYGRVNVRSGPGIGYEIVGQMDVADRAQAVARSTQQNDWLLIRFGQGEGWVAYFTVNVLGDPSTLPILVPDNTGQSLIPPSQLLQTRFNVRLHSAPDLDSQVVMIVPFGSEVTAIGRDASGTWLFVGFKDASGWGVTQLFDISREEVQSLPIHSQDAAVATPEATANP